THDHIRAWFRHEEILPERQAYRCEHRRQFFRVGAIEIDNRHVAGGCGTAPADETLHAVAEPSIHAPSPRYEGSAVRQLAPAMLRIRQKVGRRANQEPIVNHVAAVRAREGVRAAIKLRDLDLWRDQPPALKPFDDDGTLNGYWCRRPLRRVL